MVSIYCIEDINGLKYVGRTKQSIGQRMRQHRLDKLLNRNTSSGKLNLDNCVVRILENCDSKNQREREKYWIHKIDCVNIHRYQTDDPKYNKLFYHKHREETLRKAKLRYKKISNFTPISGHKKIHWDKYSKSWKYVSKGTKPKYFKNKIDAICFKFIIGLKHKNKNIVKSIYEDPQHTFSQRII